MKPAEALVQDGVEGLEADHRCTNRADSTC